MPPYSNPRVLKSEILGPIKRLTAELSTTSQAQVEHSEAQGVMLTPHTLVLVNEKTLKLLVGKLNYMAWVAGEGGPLRDAPIGIVVTEGRGVEVEKWLKEGRRVAQITKVEEKDKIV